MKSKTPFTLRPVDSISPGSIVIVIRGDEPHAAMVAEEADCKRYLFMLSGPRSGQYCQIGESQYLTLTDEAYVQAPLQTNRYKKQLTDSAPFYYVINDTSEYFAYYFNGGFDLHGIDCRTGKTGPVAGQPYFVSGWKLVVDGYDDPVAEG